MTKKFLTSALLNALLLGLCFGASAAWSQSGNPCGSLTASYGPYDYRLEAGGHLKIVDAFHFTPEVEALVHGKSGSIGGDLAYVLNTSPNHHRALASLQRYAAKLKLPQIQDMPYSVDCYFERALRFKSDDQVARMLFVVHLIETNRIPMAREQLDYVANSAEDNAFTHYNLGLLYFEIKDYEKARQHAYTSMSLGLKRAELRDKLSRIGEWKDPPATPESAASSAPEASASAPAS